VVTYLDDIAEQIRNEASPDGRPDEETKALFRIYAVLALTTGQATTPENVHDAWAAWMLGKDPHHAAIRPFADLAADVQQRDRPFAEAIRTVAARLRKP
jgi:hypothetical protein